MKIYLFNTDGWATSEYLNRTGDLPDDAHIIPAGIIPALAFWDGENVIAKTQSERDTYDTEQANAVKLSQTVFTQLQIREAFKALGEIEGSSVNEATLDNLLNAEGNEKFKTYWLEANEIDLNHTVTEAALIALNSDESQRTALINDLKLEM